jgi:uncharacterized OB-fold protein
MSTIPLPNPNDPLTAPHWQAAREGRIAMQRCPSCGYVRWPAANSCPECLAEGGEWTTLSGRGSIWSFAVYEKPLDPAFADLCPYAVALVRLDEGPMIYARMLDPPDRLSCEARVVAVHEHVTDAVSLARFKLEATNAD